MTESTEGGETFVYDDVLYPTPVLARQTPDQMGAAMLVHGYEPPAPETASVLEIGCGNGYNLIGAAAAMPTGRYVGFDLSARAIADGQELIRRAGLTNVTLEVGDILSWPRDGRFDYISCHGVYTWVPPHVRDATMELIGKVLAPGGVAYVGYDCLPAASVKKAINRFLVQEVSHIADIVDRVDTAVTLVNVMARNQLEESRLRTQLDALVKDAPSYPRAYFFHDWLAEHYNPVSIAEFAGAAAANNLRFVGDVNFHDLYEGNLDAEARAVLDRAGGDMARRNEVLDLLRGSHMFRGDILTRADSPPTRADEPLRRLRYAFPGDREAVPEQGATKFSRGTAFVLPRDGEPAEAILNAAADVYPLELDYDGLLAASGLPEEAFEPELRRLVTMAVLDVHTTGQAFTLTPGERPLAGALVRAMIRHSENAISLRHTKFVSTQDATRLLLILSDGTRTRAEIAAEMSQNFGTTIPPQQVDAAIAEFARQALFAR